MTHWTYEPEAELTAHPDLAQGDILAVTGDLSTQLTATVPLSTIEASSGFIVVTQSCDLVMRRGRMKATQIALAPVRPLSTTLESLLARPCKQASPTEPGLFCASTKYRAEGFLSKLFNQNERNAGLFFLHQDVDSGVPEHSVALLREQIATAAASLPKLLAARKGRLTAEFRAKLGWLIGYLYARPAATDFREKPNGRQQLAKLIEGFVEQYVSWIDDELAANALKQGLVLRDLSPEQRTSLLPKNSLTLAIEEVCIQLKRVKQIKDLGADAQQAVETSITNMLTNSGPFRSLFRRESKFELDDDD